MKNWLSVLAGGLALAACAASPGGKTVPLSIATTSGSVHKFKVEVAATEAEQERGLMFRKSLPADGGMIFPMNPPRIASFWMKNTVIPLDMIFIRADGTIANIAAETVPYSLEPVYANEPVVAVLEVAGGKAAKLGIAEDDKVSWPH
jgi:uncharacterized protein